MAKFIVEAGCDGAMLCAFDPAALPKDFDARVEDDPLDVMLQLQEEGRFWIDETGADGSFVFHVYVDEPVDNESLRDAPIKQQLEFRPITCPSGTLWVCGAEYAANDPRKGSAHTPKGGLDAYKMGASVDIPKGTHRLRVMRLDHEDLEPSYSPPFRWTKVAEVVGVLCCLLGGIGALFSALSLTLGSLGKLYQWIVGSPLLQKGWHALPVIAGICVASIAVFLLGRFILKRIGRMKHVVADRAAYDEARRQIPDYVFEITTNA